LLKTRELLGFTAITAFLVCDFPLFNFFDDTGLGLSGSCVEMVEGRGRRVGNIESDYGDTYER
jgi:hypothetical protein